MNTEIIEVRSLVRTYRGLNGSIITYSSITNEGDYIIINSDKDKVNLKIGIGVFKTLIEHENDCPIKYKNACSYSVNITNSFYSISRIVDKSKDIISLQTSMGNTFSINTDIIRKLIANDK